MKKALALVLALVLALSLGVSAFALTLVPLEEDKQSTASVVDLSKYQLTDWDSENEVYLVGPKGGVFYLQLPDAEYKDIEVSGTGIVSAKLVDYNPDKMTGATAKYYVARGGVTYDYSVDTEVVGKVNAKESLQTVVCGYAWVDAKGEVINEIANEEYLNTIKESVKEGYSLKEIFAYHWAGKEGFETTAGIKALKTVDPTSYEYNKALAEALNNKYHTTTFKVANYDYKNINVIEITVEENYSASYKVGSLKVTATEIERNEAGKIVDKTKVSGTVDIVSDVAIFEYEMVKWAGANDEALVVEDKTGYSDFLTDVKGYGDNYSEAALRGYKATVISTTAFRALREAKDGIKVESSNLLVTIPEIGAGQKGVNFAGYPVQFLNAKGKTAAKGEAVEVVFGFYGNQTVASDFTVEIDLGKDAYELREMFGKKVEEEDIITYYVVEGDKVVGQFTYDYMSDDLDEDIELKIERKAGSTLGQYKVVLEVPAAPSEGEENPNTGAESVIGVVAAMAVVSVAAAAAVSLKK